MWFTEGKLDENELKIRLEEIALNNSAFLCRLETQMATSADFDKAQKDEEKLELVTEGFAIHSLIHYFGKAHLAASSKMSLVARDNLEEICAKAK